MSAQTPLRSGDEIDSALNDLMMVSEMATAPVDAKGKKSVRMAESHSVTHHSTGPIVTAGGTSGSSSFSSRQFYSYSSSSSKQQVVSSSSGGTVEIPASPSINKRLEALASSSSSSSATTSKSQSKTMTSVSGENTTSASSHRNNQVDYSRINQSAAGTESLTQQQLDSPVCNFHVRIWMTLKSYCE